MFSTTLISPDNSWALWSILISIAALSIYLEQNFAWASKVTGAIIGLVSAMFLANIGVIPTDAPTYDVVWGYVVPLAIPLLLFNANIKRIWRESGRVLLVFCISAIGTIIGVAVAFLVFKNSLPDLYKMSAMMTGTYIGGSVNFAAMADAFGINKEWNSALVVADNLLMALYFFVLLTIPSIAFFRKKYTHPHVDEVENSAKKDSGKTLAAQFWSRKGISLKDIAFCMASAFVIVWVSTMLSEFLGNALPASDPTKPNLFVDLPRGFLANKYLWITTITMLLATFLPDQMNSIHGAQELGTFLIYIFLVVIGVPASLHLILTRAPMLLAYTGLIVLINMTFSLIIGKIFKFDLEEILLASNATIGGPTTASAMAIAKGWNKLIGPIMLAGIFGYIIGNYLGILMGNLLQHL